MAAVALEQSSVEQRRRALGLVAFEDLVTEVGVFNENCSNFVHNNPNLFTNDLENLTQPRLTRTINLRSTVVLIRNARNLERGVKSATRDLDRLKKIANDLYHSITAYGQRIAGHAEDNMLMEEELSERLEVFKRRVEVKSGANYVTKPKIHVGGGQSKRIGFFTAERINDDLHRVEDNLQNYAQQFSMINKWLNTVYEKLEKFDQYQATLQTLLSSIQRPMYELAAKYLDNHTGLSKVIQTLEKCGEGKRLKQYFEKFLAEIHHQRLEDNVDLCATRNSVTLR